MGGEQGGTDSESGEVESAETLRRRRLARALGEVFVEPSTETLQQLPPGTGQGLARRRRHSSSRRMRLGTTVRSVLALGSLLALLWLGTLLFSPVATGVQEEASIFSPAASPQAAGARPERSPGILYIHVSGAVKRPGVIRLPETSRVFQALEKAGGALPGARLSSLNLAAVLRDGQQVRVPSEHEETQGPTGQESTADGDAGTVHGAPSVALVSLNTASAEQLMSLPRVGKVLAERIVAWRTEHGAFSRVEELDAVDGIGPKLLEQLTPLLTLE
ncbi:helix-hairpin-helix domain-containing protein [Arthrobacter sp. NPDC090010]|uniref:helix-hairpin-helix domain-containing protein n=1 Tax=Arthrobacter sp. NPDC090010 TaxID=3363942 RepID=UPI0038185AFA